jgi:hypothetical protein
VCLHASLPTRGDPINKQTFTRERTAGFRHARQIPRVGEEREGAPCSRIYGRSDGVEGKLRGHPRKCLFVRLFIYVTS